MRVRHLLTFAVSGAVALGAAPAAAPAASPPTTLESHLINGGDDLEAAAAGDRVVLPGSAIRVRDDRTDRVTTLPANCTYLGLTGESGLAYCGTQVLAYNVTSCLGGPVALAPGEAPNGDSGSQWVLVSHHGGGSEYLNWHTGARRAANLNSQGAPTQDSDSPVLAPLKPRVQGSTVLAVQSRRPIWLAKPLYTLRLRVDGKTRTVRARCTAEVGCSGLQYDRGILSFADGNRAYAYRTRDRRLFQTSIPTARAWMLQIMTNDLTVTHTARRIYFSTRRDLPREPPSHHQVASFSAVLPGVR